MVDRLDADLVFVPMEHRLLDVQHSHKVVAQMANARRVNLDLAPYPTLVRIEAHALAHPAFEAALPKNQPDAE